MRAAHKDNICIRETSLGDYQSLIFLDRIVREDRQNSYIWNISDNSAIWYDLDSLKKYLINDFGKCKIYIAYSNEISFGLFGMLNLSEAHENANIIVWVDQAVRNKILLMRWWVYFLLEAQKAGIHHLYAKIKKKNLISLGAATRYGFTECKFIPEYLKRDMESQEICCVTRKTMLNSLEEKYVSRCLKRGF